jgi:MFS family permease
MSSLATRPFVLGFIANFAHSLAFHSYVHFAGRLEQLGADELTTGIVLATMAVSAIASRPWVGRVMDAHGRRIVVLVGSVLNVIASACYLTVDAITPWLYAIRLLHGVAEAMLFSVLFTIAADVVPRAQRTRGIALFGISGMIPLSVAGWLGDELLRVADYDALFLFATAAAIVGLAAGLFLPDSRPPADELDVAARPFFRAIWAPPLRPLWLIGFTFAIAVASYFAFLRTYVDARGVGSVASFFGAYTAAAIVLRIGFGGLPDRFGPRFTLFPAVACTAVAVALLAEAQHDATVIVAGVLGGIGHGYAFPIISALVVTRAPASERGTALSTFTALFDLGLLVGGPLLGFVLAHADYRAMYWTAGAIAFGGALAFAAWDRTRSP